jgi:heme exporter protein B
MPSVGKEGRTEGGAWATASNIMLALFLRDIRLSIRAGGGALTGVIFFLAVIATIPFGVGPDLNLLARIGPAILWIGALLACLLGLDRLFQADREDGSLDLLVLGDDRQMLALTVLTKCLAHWAGSVLPLVIAAPLLGLFMNMEPIGIGATALTLLVGTPAITFIGAAGAAVAVALPRGGLLISVLVLPLTIPVLIFGVSASYGAVANPDPFLQPFLILAALTLFLAVLGPVAAALALRHGAD